MGKYRDTQKIVPPPLFNLESALILFPLLHLSPHKLQNFASKNFFLIDLNHISMSNQNDEGSITLFAFFAVLTVLFPIYVHINIYELYGAVCPEGGGGCLLNSPPNFPILLWSFHQTLYDLFPTVIYNRGGGGKRGNCRELGGLRFPLPFHVKKEMKR